MRVSVVEIEAMDRAALIAGWEGLLGEAVPKRLSRSFLRRFLAYEVQARNCTGLPKGFDVRLRKAAKATSAKASPALMPGARLLREWNGVTHVVEATSDGFLWQGDTCRSLSAIARAITGARWSGPRFFGLTETGK